MYKLLLCSRYLTTRYIALISIVSVMLGVMTMIVVNSVMGGFHAKMRERLHGILADVIVESTSPLDGFRDADAVMQRIDELVGDRVVAMTPAIEVFAMLHFQNQGEGTHYSRPIRLIGVDAAGRGRVGDFQEHLVSPLNRQAPSFAVRGVALQYRQENAGMVDNSLPLDQGAIVGYQIATIRTQGMLADQQIIEPGQEILVTTVSAPAGRKPEPVDFKLPVVDLYKSEMSEYDSNYVFVPYEYLKSVRGGGATCIQLKLRDYSDAKTVVAKLQRAFPPAYVSVQTWEAKQGPLLEAVNIEKFLLNVMLCFIIAVAGFGILAIFFMIVVEKTRDIGILKALGASSYGIMGIFLSFGLTLGLVGSILGTIFGITFSLKINEIEQLIHNLTGTEVFPRDIYYFKEIPTQVDPLTVALIVLGALVIAVAASVLPARRAAMFRPVEALRYE